MEISHTSVGHRLSSLFRRTLIRQQSEKIRARSDRSVGHDRCALCSDDKSFQIDYRELCKASELSQQQQQQQQWQKPQTTLILRDAFHRRNGFRRKREERCDANVRRHHRFFQYKKAIFSV